VVGGGPAGLTAATYLGRFHRKCLVLDAGDSRARWIPESNNCPGFPNGVSGVELLRRMKQQASEFAARFESARIDSIERDGDAFVLLAGARQWRARSVILATGLSDKLPDAPWVEKAIACHALRLCAICDAYEASDTRIGVHGLLEDIGAHGSFLRAYSEQVYLLPKDRDEDATDDALRTALAAGVQMLPAGGTLGFDGERCTWTTTQGTAVFDSVYPYLGCLTSAGLASALGAALSESGEIIVDRHQRTNVSGLYAIGDVVSGLNQISVAVGQAALAATHLHNQLPFAPRVNGAARTS
ncbi:MAG TPA: NAD(P)/FAD-dependent oxidoreductase, partial [Pseudoxanthomonas sp.]|nr:NAD(P)/FAD-dependent oxidoreductase [Pseudoxanthomonas sp.]